eukprot:GHUV01032744.1.p2 GENE.GHUV01032744.1~~GHUV01032744.1.p2  ORF type:complete len:129 (-),score=39.27 GHUV01032744.1:226-612(-)
MGVAMAIGLFDRLESVAMVPTHVWDAVPGDVVSSVILATAAATAAKVDFNQYRNSKIGSSEDPPVVHAGVGLGYRVAGSGTVWLQHYWVSLHQGWDLPAAATAGQMLFLRSVAAWLIAAYCWQERYCI